jgi:Carboxypeptidase regulatory-like domain/TonB dependent receptor-like, beta-barrel
MRSRNLFRIVLVCLMLSGLALAQGVGASGDIKGVVTDPSGAVVANATVTATDVDKGIKHTVTSDSNGQYHLIGLQPATYSLSVTKSGFQPEVAKNVTVTIGQTNTVNFPMKVSQVSEQVEVSTEPPVVETERGSQANVINENFIRELPINRRDYLSFTLLAPAVSDSTRLSSDQDYRVKQTPQSGLSFYGSNGRGNSVTVDGGEVNDDAGGVRLNMGQDAVQEFQINRSNYGADLGGASGATINIVTKSGSNDVHGSLFGYFRNDAMDAANPFSVTQALAPGQAFNPLAPDVQGVHTKDSLTREQFGGTIGFPIKKDKTFLFSSFEGLMSDAQNAVPILTNTSVFRPQGASTGNNQQAIIAGLAAQGATIVPCLTNPANPTTPVSLPAAVCAQALTSGLTISPLTGLTAGQTAVNSYLINQFEGNGGLFPYDTRVYLASTRLDHQFSDKNQIALRYSFGHDREENPDVTSLTGFSRGSSVKAFDHTLLASWFHQFSGRTSNEAHVQWNYSNFDVVPNAPGQIGLDIPGFANLGTQIFLPSFTIMRRYEFADNLTMVRGKHTFKLGGYELLRGNHSESHTFFPGRFVFGNLPGSVLSPCLANPSGPITANPATTGCGVPGGLAGAALDSLQAASLGAPQFYQQGFGNPIYNYPRPFTAAYVQDQWSMASNFTLNFGVRYEVDAQYGALSTDKNNFAPRLSFAWDPFKDHKTVVRAGYGIFYSPIYGQIADVVQTLGFVNGKRQIAQVFVPLSPAVGPPSGVCPLGLTSACIFGNFFGQGLVQCSTPAAGNAACITPANLVPFGINVTNVGPPPPLSVVFSGQPNYRNPYSQQAEFGIEREIAKGWSVSLSGVYVHTIGLPVAIDTNALPTAPFTPIQLANGAIVQLHNFNTGTSPIANPCAGPAIVTCFAQPQLLQTDQYSSAGAALYEGAILEVKKRFSTHFSLLANYTLSKAFDTVTDFNSDFGPQDNTNLAAERALSNFDQRHKVVVAGILDTGNRGGPVLSGFQLAPIVRYNSGHPFNLLAGADVNGDRHSTNDRPIGAARNTGEGPDFADFDMRITRRFKLGEHANLQILAEGFNLFNRTNYASVNNIVGPTLGLTPGFTTFNVQGIKVDPTQSLATPLAFTSAFPMRQLQFGVRVGF